MFKKVVQVGLLDRDPELRYTPAADASCNFTLATKEKFRSKDGQLQERIEWRSGGGKQSFTEIAVTRCRCWG